MEKLRLDNPIKKAYNITNPDFVESTNNPFQESDWDIIMNYIREKWEYKSNKERLELIRKIKENKEIQI